MAGMRNKEGRRPYRKWMFPSTFMVSNILWEVSNIWWYGLFGNILLVSTFWTEQLTDKGDWNAQKLELLTSQGLSISCKQSFLCRLRALEPTDGQLSYLMSQRAPDSYSIRRSHRYLTYQIKWDYLILTYLESLSECLSVCLSLSPSFFILSMLPRRVGLGLTFLGESETEMVLYMHLFRKDFCTHLYLTSP